MQEVRRENLNMTKTGEAIKKVDKVVVNTGIGRLAAQPNFSDKILPSVVNDFAAITGQKPRTRPAKKSISGFKLREGTVVGLQSTLRRHRAKEFIEKIIKVVLPRVRDFRGINLKNIDERGNLSFGIRETLVFPEISQEISKTAFGLEITIVPKRVKTRSEAIEIYKELGLLFEKNKHA